jgi:hypothetical protein
MSDQEKWMTTGGVTANTHEARGCIPERTYNQSDLDASIAAELRRAAEATCVHCRDGAELIGKQHRLNSDATESGNYYVDCKATAILSSIQPDQQSALEQHVEAAIARHAHQFTCKANKGADPPQDCDWPVCGCDPYTDQVIAALQEAGHITRADAAAALAIVEAREFDAGIRVATLELNSTGVKQEHLALEEFRAALKQRIEQETARLRKWERTLRRYLGMNDGDEGPSVGSLPDQTLPEVEQERDALREHLRWALPRTAIDLLPKTADGMRHCRYCRAEANENLNSESWPHTTDCPHAAATRAAEVK